MSGDAAGRLHEAVARQDWAAAASVLSELCALVKKQADRERLCARLDHSALYASLACVEPKAR